MRNPNLVASCYRINKILVLCLQAFGFSSQDELAQLFASKVSQVRTEIIVTAVIILLVLPLGRTTGGLSGFLDCSDLN